MEYNDESFAAYLRKISNLPLVTKQEEIILAAKVANNDDKARERLINANLRLVVKIAQEFTGYGLPLMDLISEGNIGLMKAVDRFKPEKGGKLSTYASWWIKQGIKRSLANKGKIIRIPVHLVEKMGRVRKVVARLTEELGREPTIVELANEVGINAKKLEQSFNHCIQPISIYEQTGNDCTIADIIIDEDAEDPLKVMIHKDLLAKLPKLLSVLTKREREIIVLRYGLEGVKQKTLEEVGAHFNITRERIRQLQNLAIEKMYEYATKDLNKF
jgi:RNA polymerase primary sigma factor